MAVGVRPARREGRRKEEGLNQGMGDILEGRGLYLCAGMQEGEVGSKWRSRGGANRPRNNRRQGRQGKDGSKRETHRNKDELPVCCGPEKIPVWDMGEESMGNRIGKASHPPWNVQKQRVPGVSDPQAIHTGMRSQSGLPFQGSPTTPWGTSPHLPIPRILTPRVPCALTELGGWSNTCPD